LTEKTCYSVFDEIVALNNKDLFSAYNWMKLTGAEPVQIASGD